MLGMVNTSDVVSFDGIVPVEMRCRSRTHLGPGVGPGVVAKSPRTDWSQDRPIVTGSDPLVVGIEGGT